MSSVVVISIFSFRVSADIVMIIFISFIMILSLYIYKSSIDFSSVLAFNIISIIWDLSLYRLESGL